jgi:hypothetical protein
MAKKNYSISSPRSLLTADQQGHVRSNLMKSAGKIARQLDDYVEEGKIMVAGREVKLTSERLTAYKMILDRTIPTLSSTEIKRTTALEGMTSAQLVDKLAALVKARPELAEKLMGALGGRLIQHEAATNQTSPKPAEQSAEPGAAPRTLS